MFHLLVNVLLVSLGYACENLNSKLIAGAEVVIRILVSSEVMPLEHHLPSIMFDFCMKRKRSYSIRLPLFS